MFYLASLVNLNILVSGVVVLAIDNVVSIAKKVAVDLLKWFFLKEANQLFKIVNS